MRTLTQLVVLAVIALSAWNYIPKVSERWQSQLRTWRDRRSIEDTVRSVAYRINQDGWLEFDLPKDAVGIRMLTNAALVDTVLPSITPNRPRRGWKYSIDYELLDDQLEPIKRRRYHIRTRISHRQDAGTEYNEGQTWFQDSRLVPAQTRTVQVPLQKATQRPRRLRVRLGMRDEQIEEVVLRLYFKNERPDYEQPYAWSRLSVSARQRLCRASVYPPDLLAPWERRNLLRWNWTALPPIGIRQIDYEHRMIYQREDPQAVDFEFLPPPDGLTCQPGIPLTIPTPGVQGVTKLDFFPDHERSVADDGVVDVRVHRKLLGVIAHRKYRVSDLRGPLTLDTEGDLIEVNANDYVICVAQWQPIDTDKTDSLVAPTTLGSSRRKIRGYLTDPDDPLEYVITHVNQLETPMRVTLRRLVPRPVDKDPAEWPKEILTAAVRYEFLDTRGEVVQRGTLDTLPEVARYDRASIGVARMLVSEPSTHFFALPLSVANVRFRCDQEDVAIIAFTRPSDLPRTYRVPEERGLFEQRREIGRTWFIFRPIGHYQRLSDNRCANISIQTRPLPINEQLVSGQYDWKDYRSREFTPGRFVLTPRDPSFALRDEAVPSTYCEIPINQDVAARWRGDDTETLLEPRLIYDVADDERDVAENGRKPIRVLVNGTTLFEFTPRARRGEVALPEVAVSSGLRSVRIDATAGSRVFLRNVELANAACYVKRFAYELNGDALSFDVVKYSDEPEQLVLKTLFGRSHSGADPRVANPDRLSTERLTIEAHLRIDGRRRKGRLDGWTLERRVYEIAPGDSESAMMVHGKLSYIDQGESCVVVLGADLPPGTYRLEIRRTQPTDSIAFVSLYRIRPPSNSKRQARTDRWIPPAETRAVSAPSQPTMDYP